MATVTGRLISRFEHFFTVHVPGDELHDDCHVQFRIADTTENSEKITVRDGAKIVHRLGCDCKKPDPKQVLIPLDALRA